MCMCVGGISLGGKEVEGKFRRDGVGGRSSAVVRILEATLVDFDFRSKSAFYLGLGIVLGAEGSVCAIPFCNLSNSSPENRTLLGRQSLKSTYSQGIMPEGAGVGGETLCCLPWLPLDCHSAAHGGGGEERLLQLHNAGYYLKKEKGAGMAGGVLVEHFSK